VTRATPLAAYRNADATAEPSQAAVARLAELSREFSPDINFVIHRTLESVEEEWRRFEQFADCTAFQSFDWLTTWYRHIGSVDGVIPVIAVGSFTNGETALIAPLAIHPDRTTRRLCWLAQEQCDYNAPLLSPDFSQRIPLDRFLTAWQELRTLIKSDSQLRYDWIELEKMPRLVGAQINPFTYLPVTINPSGAHLTQLGDDWEKFYFAKRSSATRRRDRAKRRHISEFGEIRFITITDPDEAKRTLEALIEQKSRAFARRGIPDIFQRPGFKEFFFDLATNPNLRHLFHISRIEVGDTLAATNFAIVFGDCYYHVLASYDDTAAMSHYGTGALHLRELLAYAIGRGLRRFDFTIGDEPYKLEWSDCSLELFDHSVAATWRGWPISLLSLARRRVKRFVKQTPITWRLVSSVRSTIGALTHIGDLKPEHSALSRGTATKSRQAVACVMGDMDLLQPLAEAHIPCAVVTRPGVPSLYSRHARARLAWEDFSQNSEALLDAMLRFGRAQPERPVLFYQEDAQLFFVSRHREQLAEAFRFVVPEASLVEDLVDKARFAALAKRLDLPVPASRQFHPIAAESDDLDLRFPVIIKPLTRLGRWNDVFGLRKAVEVRDAESLHALWPQLTDVGIDLLVQELIPGAETQVESYHCYVDNSGSTAAEFTGKKIRTYPLSYGHTTALEITDIGDVRSLGRDIVQRLCLTGVAKLDFKRDPAGKLHLLEINPRFTLWHNAAAVAGVNIPALVHADLTGAPRPKASRATAGTRWCKPWNDFPAARGSGVSLAEWVTWTLRCESKSVLSWRDPMPAVRSTLHRLLASRASAGAKNLKPQDWIGL
jgi:CelD/BcsL family acetyltransferase involved in cellulose biosynthesis/predicted ATP-grasp superfamily ATP-dependent carboligase